MRSPHSCLQPRSRTGTLQVAFSSVFFFFSKGGEEHAELRFPPVREEGKRRGVRPLSARHGFLEGHRRFRRPSHVIGAETRVSGHLNYLRERQRERERERHRRSHFFFFYFFFKGKPALRMLSALPGGNQLKPILL